MFRKLLGAACLLASTCAWSQERYVRDPASYHIMVDSTLSSIVGAEDLLTLERYYECAEDYLWTGVLSHENDSCLCQMAGIGVRGLKGIFLDLPVAQVFLILQHEFFGHGARIREFSDARDASYHFNAPFPYGDGGGSTFYRVSPGISLTRRIAIATGGVEATSVLAQTQALKWIQNGKTDYRECLTYLLCYQDQTLYALGSSGPFDGDINGSDDMSAYVGQINAYYGRQVLDIDTLRNRSLLNFFDPFTYISLYNYGRFLWAGKPCGHIPMFCVNDWRFLPQGRLVLTPFGTQYSTNFYGFYQNCPFKATVGFGATDGDSYYGLGAEVPKIYRWDNWDIGVRANTWVQPKYGERNTQRFGFMGTVTAQFNCFADYALYFELGGKTSGFVPGEALDGALIARAGITIFEL